MKLGDAVESLVKPVAKAINHPCLDEQGNTKPESKCGKKITGLNNLGDAMWDFLWPNSTKQKE